jgi:hypothetical protein
MYDVSASEDGMNGILQQLNKMSERELARLNDAIDEELQRRLESLEEARALPNIEELRALEYGRTMPRGKVATPATPATDDKVVKPRRAA